MARNELLQVEREALILRLIQERGAVSVHDLSRTCNVTAVTIRRDLQRLEERHLLRRTHGGAIPYEVTSPEFNNEQPLPPSSSASFISRIDVLIMTYARTQRSRLLFEQVQRQHIPAIAESEMLDGAQYVGIDNYSACYELGKWVGYHTPEHLKGPVRVLDITYHFPGSRRRSQGFIDGLTSTLPTAKVVLSVDGRSLRDETRLIVEDALSVYPDINVIFAINDDSAIGALDACRAAGLDEDSVIIIWVGLDGPTTRRLLAERSPLKACVAMFPELVARVALGVAIRAYAGNTDRSPVITPTAILTADTLGDYYQIGDWTPQPSVLESLIASYPDAQAVVRDSYTNLPSTVGFVLPFKTHEWYQTITRHMQQQADRLHIDLLIEDATASPDIELESLARSIGAAAAELVKDGDTIILDHETASLHLARHLIDRQNLTVITNSVAVLQTFADHPNIHVIVTGGNLYSKSRALGGRVAELALAEFHADKVFVGMAGVNQQFGLSNVNHSLAQIQRAMIGAAQRVIVLADHTRIGAASRVKVAPLLGAYTLVTDSGISPADRLLLSQLGIQVVVASG